MEYNIRILIVFVRVFYMGLLLCKHLFYFIVRHFALIIYRDYNKSYRLAYKV